MSTKSPPESQATRDAANLALRAFDGKLQKPWDESLQISPETADTPIGRALERMRQCWGCEQTYADRRRLRTAASGVRTALNTAYPPHSWHWTTTSSVAVISAVAIFVLYRIST